MFTLPSLSYAYDALEPHFDSKTMEIHHTKHHQTYIDKLNEALQSLGKVDDSIESLLTNVSNLPMAVRNHGGGYYNHDLFWQILSADGLAQPDGTLAKALTASFGSFSGFQEEFSQAALNQFGSGWAWLVVSDGTLQIGSTPNQDNPLMDVVELSGTPILGLDVWEHAYYLKYQNRRPDYVAAFWKVINWQEVSRRFQLATE